MPKLNLRTATQMRVAAGAVTALKGPGISWPAKPMVLEIDTTLTTGTTFSLPMGLNLLPPSNVDATVNWGDGTEETFTTPGFKSHTYAQEGQYTITITGLMTNYGSGSSATTTSQRKLTRVVDWGDIGLISLRWAFFNGGNPELPSQAPPGLQDCAHLFRQSIFTGLGAGRDISQWDVSQCDSFDGVFQNHQFDGSLSGWDTGNVNNMNNHFRNGQFTGVFDGQPALPANYVGPSVTSMEFFVQLSRFNAPVDGWDVSNVTNMLAAFGWASGFPGPNFDQSLETFVLNPNVNIQSLINRQVISPTNYARTLIGWANNIFSRGGVVVNRNFGATDVKYSTATINDIPGEFDNAVDARNYLVNTLGWTITDGGPA